MTFEEFFTNAVERGMNPTHRPAMLCAWDAAVCAAQQGCQVRGKLKTNEEIYEMISEMHSWVKKPETQTLSDTL